MIIQVGTTKELKTKVINLDVVPMFEIQGMLNKGQFRLIVNYAGSDTEFTITKEQAIAIVNEYGLSLEIPVP